MALIAIFATLIATSLCLWVKYRHVFKGYDYFLHCYILLYWGILQSYRLGPNPGMAKGLWEIISIFIAVIISVCVKILWPRKKWSSYAYYLIPLAILTCVRLWALNPLD